VYLTGGANVTGSIASPGAYSSVLSVEEIGKWRRLAARFKRLDIMAKKLRSIELKTGSGKDGKG
jgi:UDP-3-O-[3-hydroxymyristoyl] glucosamine N-acyltransferase